MTKSIRIKNMHNQKATVWPIGEFLYNVRWDDDIVNNFRVAKHNVDEMLAKGQWTEIDDNDLPDTFKFTVEDGLQDFYVATKQGNNYHITWDVSDTGTYYSVDNVERHVETGNWKIIEDRIITFCEGYSNNLHNNEEVIYTDYLEKLVNDLVQWQSCMSYNDSYFGEPEGFLKKTIRQMAHEMNQPKETYKENWATTTTYHQGEKIMHEDELLVCTDGEEQDILERIQQFTFCTGHTVMIDGGSFEVYREDEDVPYTTDCEHCLLDIMKAIEVLDEHGN